LAAISIIGSLVFVAYLDIEMSEEEQGSIRQRFEPALAEYKAVSLDSAPGTNQRRHSGQIVVINGDTGQLSPMQFENFRFGILHSRPEGFIATRPEDAKTLVVIDDLDELLFSYSGGIIRPDGTSTNGVPVYRRDRRVRIIDLATEVTLASHVFQGVGESSFPDKANVWTLHEGSVLLRGSPDIRISILKKSDGEPYGISAEGLPWSEVKDLVVDLWNDG
jgi:hypothetical protein